MTDLIWSRPARDDLLRQVTHIARADASAAARIGDAIEARAIWLLDTPSAGQLIHGTIDRSFRVFGTPYVLVYRVLADAIVILRVHHTSQDWRPR